jgi:hypothetical protein|tara:strand:+ start:4260 stop:4409 length:150 start_codon:yes stop_codon:yes gene_type:complete
LLLDVNSAFLSEPFREPISVSVSVSVSVEEEVRLRARVWGNFEFFGSLL